MAVTIHNTPQAYTPSDNPVNWTFSSDMTDEDNFVFLVEIYVNDALVTNELVFPDNGINGRFDAKSYASNGCDSPRINNVIFQDALNYTKIKIKVIERYGDPVEDEASATSDNVYVWKARLDDDDFVVYDSDDYVLPGADKKWLSNFPDGHFRMVKDFGEQQRVMAITNETTGLSFGIRLYDSDANFIVGALGIDVDEYWPITIFNFSPEQIVSFTAITQLQFEAAAYYTIEFSDSLPDLRINIDRGHVYEYNKRIHFLSEIGSIESFTFALISRPQGKIKSFGYRKGFGEWDNEDFNYSREQGRDIDYAKVSERKLVIESDWLMQEIQHWLHRNLFESPLVLEEAIATSGSYSTTLIRRKIMQTAWADKYNKNDTLFKEQITLGLPHKTSMIL